MCLGCLFVFLAVSFPRVALLITWIFTPWVEIVFEDNWFLPLAGLILLPFTTLTYVMVNIAYVGPPSGFGWLLVILAGFLDVSHWAQTIYNRKNGVQFYNTYGPGRTSAIPTD